MNLTVACVLTGDKYSVDYVSRLRSMVERHLPIKHDFVCVTDRLAAPGNTVFPHPCLPGWWGKMHLFDRSLIAGRIIYLDLDTVILNDLTPLAEWDGNFGICQNFTQIAGHPTWPCRYGSCVMSIGPGFGTEEIWVPFSADADAIMRRCDKGDQQAIEELYSGATYLQDVLPADYFIGHRDMTDSRPSSAVAVFGGSKRPHNSPFEWVKQEWK